MAAAARSNGAEVTLLESLDQPLERVLGAEVAAIFADLHREHGVDLRTSVHVTGIERSGDGAAGAPARRATRCAATCSSSAWASSRSSSSAGAAGLDVDNGIRTDAHLRTSDAAVYAAGDVANADHPVLGRPVRVEHWDTAIKHGGSSPPTCSATTPCTTRCPTSSPTSTTSAWSTSAAPAPTASTASCARRHRGLDFTAWWLRGDEVVAGMHVNDWDAIDDVRRLVGQHVDVDRLANESVELSSLGE